MSRRPLRVGERLTDEERDEITKGIRAKGAAAAAKFRAEHPEIAERTRAQLDRRAAEFGHRSFDDWVAALREQMEREGRR